VVEITAFPLFLPGSCVLSHPPELWLSPCKIYLAGVPPAALFTLSAASETKALAAKHASRFYAGVCERPISWPLRSCCRCSSLRASGIASRDLFAALDFRVLLISSARSGGFWRPHFTLSFALGATRHRVCVWKKDKFERSATVLELHGCVLWDSAEGINSTTHFSLPQRLKRKLKEKSIFSPGCSHLARTC
jgi:hypothetical protein